MQAWLVEGISLVQPARLWEKDNVTTRTPSPKGLASPTVFTVYGRRGYLILLIM